LPRSWKVNTNMKKSVVAIVTVQYNIDGKAENLLAIT
jgi:hypothetical protein